MVLQRNFYNSLSSYPNRKQQQFEGFISSVCLSRTRIAKGRRQSFEQHAPLISTIPAHSPLVAASIDRSFTLRPIPRLSSPFSTTQRGKSVVIEKVLSTRRCRKIVKYFGVVHTNGDYFITVAITRFYESVYYRSYDVRCIKIPSFIGRFGFVCIMKCFSRLSTFVEKNIH